MSDGYENVITNEEEDDFANQFRRNDLKFHETNFEKLISTNHETQNEEKTSSVDMTSDSDLAAGEEGDELDRISSSGSLNEDEEKRDPHYDFKTAHKITMKNNYIKANKVAHILLGPSPRHSPILEPDNSEIHESGLTSVQEVEEEQEENARISILKQNDSEIKSISSDRDVGESIKSIFDPYAININNEPKKEKNPSLDDSFSPDSNIKKTETLWKQRSLRYEKDDKPERMRYSRKFRHLRFIVFPDDPLKDIWDISQAILIVYTLIFFPFQLAFMHVNDDEEDAIGWVVIDYIMTGLFFVDIVLNFFTAFHDDNDNLIVSRRQIARIYLKGWFIVDFFTVFPFDLIFATSKYNSFARIARLPRLSRLSKLLKFMRIFKVLRERDKLIEYVQNLFQGAVWVGRLLLAVFSLLIFCHVGACGWALAATFEESPNNWIDYYGYTDDEPGVIYTAAFYWISQTVITTGYGDISPKNTGERFYACLLMLSGVIFYSFSIGSITSLVTKLDEKKSNLDDKLMTLMNIRRKYRIDMGLFDRLKRAVKIDQFFKQEISDLFNQLPPYLRTDLAFLMYRDQLLSIEFFQDKSVRLIAEIGPCLKKVIIKPEEFILVRGENANEMYFIKRGKIAVCMPKNFMEFAYLEEGSFFGGLDIILERNRTYDYKAKEESTLLMLDKKNFQRIFFQDFYNYGAEFYKESLKTQVSLRTLYKEAVDYYKTLMKEQEDAKKFNNFSPATSPIRLSRMTNKQRDSITKRFWKKDRKFKENTEKIDEQLEGIVSQSLSKTGSNEIFLFKERKDSPDVKTLEQLSHVLDKTTSLEGVEPDATPNVGYHRTLLKNMSRDKNEKFISAQAKLKSVVHKIHERSSVAKIELLTKRLDMNRRLGVLAARMERTEADFKNALDGLARAGLPIKLSPNFNPPKIIISDFNNITPKTRRVTDILHLRESERTPVSAEQFRDMYNNRGKNKY